MHFQIQFWKTMEGPSTVKEHLIVYEEHKECLTPASASSAKTDRGVRSTGHVYNLWPATTVSARVVAVNGNYEGLPSATINFRTKEGGQCGRQHDNMTFSHRHRHPHNFYSPRTGRRWIKLKKITYREKEKTSKCKDYDNCIPLQQARRELSPCWLFKNCSHRCLTVKGSCSQRSIGFESQSSISQIILLRDPCTLFRRN